MYRGYYGLFVVTPRPQTLHRSHDNLKNPYRIATIFVSPVRLYIWGYYGLVVVTPRLPHPPCPPPRRQTFHRSHDNLKNPYRIASIFYM